MIGRKLDSIDLDTIYYGFTHGAPATTVAEVIGCHPDTVRKSYKRLHDAEGGARHKPHAPWPHGVRRDVVMRYESGESATSIARDVGCDRTSVYQWVRAHRKERDG